MQTFIDDDAGYLGWVHDHPDGFVLNTHRSPLPSYVRLHSASCRHLRGTPANGKSWTSTYIKTCGRRAELEQFALNHIGGEVWVCPSCLE